MSTERLRVGVRWVGRAGTAELDSTARRRSKSLTAFIGYFCNQVSALRSVRFAPAKAGLVNGASRMYRGAMLKSFFVCTIALATGVLAVGSNAAQPGKKSSLIESARSAGAASDSDTV